MLEPQRTKLPFDIQPDPDKKKAPQRLRTSPFHTILPSAVAMGQRVDNVWTPRKPSPTGNRSRAAVHRDVDKLTTSL
jgi:hypothetical protein